MFGARLTSSTSPSRTNAPVTQRAIGGLSFVALVSHKVNELESYAAANDERQDTKSRGQKETPPAEGRRPSDAIDGVVVRLCGLYLADVNDCQQGPEPGTQTGGNILMSNIVYVLTNPAMPGIVKIGMTDGVDVRDRMARLYSTGVPFPFDCVIARQIEDRGAAEIERALHTAFGPNRVNPSREFFQLDPEQVLAVLLQVLPGRDVTPQVGANRIRPTFCQVTTRRLPRSTRRRQGPYQQVRIPRFPQCMKGEFVYERVLGTRDSTSPGCRVNWGLKGFSLNASIRKDSLVPVVQWLPAIGFQPAPLHGLRQHCSEKTRTFLRTCNRNAKN